MKIMKRTITRKTRQAIMFSFMVVFSLFFSSIFLSLKAYAMDSGRSSVSKLTMSQVREMYQNIGGYSSLYRIEPVVSGDYAISTLSDEAYETGKNWINFYRAVAGLAPIDFTATLNESAAYGALVNAANLQMSHYPTQPSGMSTEMYNLGCSATSQSNLSSYYGSGVNPLEVIGLAIGGQMKDQSNSNVDRLGHRRWLLNPNVLTMGIGSANNGTYYYSAVRVFGSGVSTSTVNDYEFISWPASGNNISDVFGVEVPWSITLNPQKYSSPSLSDVKVTLEEVSTGKTWNFSSATDTSTIGSTYDYFNINNDGYGISNCIVFRPAYSQLEEYHGDYNVTVTGLKDKSGNATSISYQVNFEPNQYKEVSDLSISVSTSPLVYDGTAKKPAVTVKDGYLLLTEGVDYTLAYNNNVNAGTGAVRVIGTGRKYAGFKTLTFTISRAEQAVTVSPSQISMDEGSTASISVSGQQGSVSYSSSNTNVATVSSSGVVTGLAAGSANITVSVGVTQNYNAYTKIIPVTVTKNAIDISTCNITLSSDTFVYDGSAKTPEITVKDGTKTLTNGSDYSLTYSSNVNVGTARVTITGMGDYTGSVSESFSITKADQTLNISPPSFNIKEGATGMIHVTRNGTGTLLYVSSDESVVTVSSSGVVTGIAAGTATIRVYALGDSNYNDGIGFVSVTVSKNVDDISDCTITMTTEYGIYEGMGDYIYDGTEKIPEITVKKGTTTLVDGIDYSLSYANNINAGIATVTISGKGNYAGTVSRTYTIDKAMQTISVNPSSITVNMGESATIQATAYGSLTYTSNNTSIAMVDSEGRVVPVAVGSTYITVKASGNNNYEAASTSVHIDVIAAKQPQTVTYEVYTKKLPIKGTTTVSGKGYGSISYISSNPAVATINSSGTVTAVAAGTTTITVKAAGNSNYEAGSVSFTMTVENRVAEGQGPCGMTAEWYFCSDGTLRIVGKGLASLYYQGAAFPETGGRPTGGTMNWSEYSDRVKDIYVEDGITELISTLFSLDDNEEYYKASPRSITIADSVTKMGMWMFCGCDQLTTINIGSGMSEMGEECFWKCTGLKEINVSSDNQTYASIDGALYTKDKKTLLVHPAVTGASVVIPDGVTTLSLCSLRYMNSMTSLTIPASVNSISYNACTLCPALTDVYYGGSQDDWNAAFDDGKDSDLCNANVHFGKTIPLTGGSISLSQTSYSYDGNAKTPSVTVKTSAGVTLTETKDYILSYSDNTDAGTATVTVTGTNAYSGTLTKTFTITKVNQVLAVSPAMISMNVGDSKQLNAIGKGNITYTSSDTAVATVNTSGLVTAVAAGSANITVTAAGDNNYNAASQTVPVTVTRNAIDLSTCTITLESNSYIYDGTVKTPSVTVKDGTNTLINGTHYTMVYNNNTDAGTANVTITGIGDYTGTASKTFTITKANQTLNVSPSSMALTVGDRQTISANGVGSITYSSSNTAVATVDGNGLVKAVAAGSATITIKAAGDSNHNAASTSISVSVTEPVDIRVSLSTCTITLGTNSYVYDGNAKLPVVTVKDGGTTLVNGTHYSVMYSDNINVGTGTVTITGIGDYTGTVSKTFTITKASQTLNVSPSSMALTVGDSQSIIASGTGNITYSSSNTTVATVDANGLVKALAAGSASITVRAAGDSNHDTASTSVSVSVTEPVATKVSLSTCTITLGTSSYVYDGRAKLPVVTVKDGGTTLVNGTHYSVMYGNNINAGTGTVTITGIGDYTGTVTRSFTITKASQMVSAAPSNMAMIVGDSQSIIASGIGNITYTSSNTAVATVDENGIIKALAAGDATITVRATGDNNHNTASTNVYVVVSNPSGPVDPDPGTDPVEPEVKSISDCDEAGINGSSFTYTGSAIKPKAYVIYDGVRLAENVDFVIDSYANNVNAGRASVTIKGIGNYNGSIKMYFDILPKATAVTAANVTKIATSSRQSFSIGARCSGNNPLTYQSNNPNVLVSGSGQVTIKEKFCGQAIVTIVAKNTTNYKSSMKQIAITVLPTKVAWKSLKTPAKKKIAITWKKNIYADGYELYCSKSPSFSSGTKSLIVSKFSSATYKKTVTKLTSKKKYYVKIRAFKKVGNTRLYGSWSSVKKIKVK
ncbi:MAG: Ig-like domain-containing protein [Eubacteriales bacterium]|nr:Ig-like domain-containing protein [Eubacteriales bacterium]